MRFRCLLSKGTVDLGCGSPRQSTVLRRAHSSPYRSDPNRMSTAGTKKMSRIIVGLSVISAINHPTNMKSIPVLAPLIAMAKGCTVCSSRKDSCMVKEPVGSAFIYRCF